MSKALLLSPAGQAICSAMRRETWFVLMSSSSDRTIRELGASIFVAAALDALVPARAAWDEKPACAHCGRSLTATHFCPRKQADDYLSKQAHV